MAFGKKKQDEAPAAPEPETPPDEQPEEEQPDASVLETPAEGEPAADAGSQGPATAEKPEAAADPLGGDLLNMFQTTKLEVEDLSVVLDLAGDVEMDDLLEELHTVALALGCQLEEVRDDESELLAA